MFVFVDFETTGLSYKTSYPIEIGCIFTDEKLKIVQKYDTYIKWNSSFFDESGNWKNEYLSAFKIHKIYPHMYETGRNSEDVCGDLSKICGKMIKDTGKKPIIVSDCANFEFFFMKKLFEESGTSEKFKDLFHYCAWDTNMITWLLDLKEPPIKPHVAMQDIMIEYDKLVKAFKDFKK